MKAVRMGVLNTSGSNRTDQQSTRGRHGTSCIIIPSSSKLHSTGYYYKILLPLLLLLLLAAAAPGCKRSVVAPGSEPRIVVMVDDAACTEAWLKISVSNIPLPLKAGLYQNGIARDTLTLTTPDTMLYVDKLPVNQRFSFQLKTTVLNDNNESRQYSSITAEGKTLDTTSHSYTWQKWVLGHHTNNTIYDALLINENDILVSGVVRRVGDTLGRTDPYNWGRWNGLEWKLTTATYGPEQYYSRIVSFHRYSDKNIYLSNFIRWDGTRFTDMNYNIPLFGRITKAWGANEKRLYYFGTEGLLARYEDGKFTLLNSKTTVDINDVWGVVNKQDGSFKLFMAVSYNANWDPKRILVMDEKEQIDSIPWRSTMRIASVWTKDGKRLYTAGGGIFQNKSGSWKEETKIPYYTGCIRGTDWNDIWVAGDYGVVAHYNGVSWKEYPAMLTDGYYLTISLKDNMVVIAGNGTEGAVLYLGKRQ